MKSKPNYQQIEANFLDLLEKKPLPVAELLTLIETCTLIENEKKSAEWVTMLMQELTEQNNFAGLYLVIKNRCVHGSTKINATSIRDLLKKTNKDRLISAFIDTAGFGVRSLDDSFRCLDLLLALTPGTWVIDPTWGFGITKRLDDFYQRATIDFINKPNHTMTFTSICDNITRAPQDHLLTLCHTDPEAVKNMVAVQPGEVVKRALRSFGNMPLQKLEELLTRHHIVEPTHWKNFWEAARKDLKSDPLVVLPAKRTDLLQLRTETESYGARWFETFAELKDATKILDAIIELETHNRNVNLENNLRDILEERLAFAIKGAYNTQAALYVRLALTINRWGGVTAPTREQMRAHLWENNRYIQAAQTLIVRDVSAMTLFLLDEGNASITRLLEALPHMPFNLLNEVLNTLKEHPEAEETCRRLLGKPKAPPTLILWIFRSRQTLKWTLPPITALLNHAIAVVESRLSGESLRMQNNLKQLFEQPKWMNAIFEELDTLQRQLIFERIQASTAWDPSTHHSLLAQMLKLDPSLSAHKKTIAPLPENKTRWTSWRSLAAHQAQHKRLVEIELPQNSKDIAVARSYGDLRENFEYQAAKDYQRQLLQRQSDLNLELQKIKGTNFDQIATDRVSPGTTVVLHMANDTIQHYTILGEWDRDEQLNIISSQTRLALCVEGKRVGETVSIPTPNGEQPAKIEAILPLDETIKTWIRTPPPELT